ncbi:MAG: FAD-dependent oxidoreductase [Hyphomicrobiaceae bacterium]
MKIVIVGAGIVGLSIARSALRRGHHVTIVEQGAIPNPDSASFDEHRMIRFQYNDAEGYARMVRDAFAAWDRLWTEIGRCHFADSGVVSISLASGDYADRSLATIRRAGLPHEVVTGAALARLVPQLDLPAHASCVLCHPSGALLADRIVTDLAALVAERGAVLVPQSRVTAVDDAEASITLASGQRISADLVIVAAGAWLERLLPDDYASVPVQRQTLCYVRAPDDFTRAWHEGPALCVIGDRNVYTLPPRAGTGLKFGSGMLRKPAGPDQGFAPDSVQAREVIGAFAPYLRDAGGYEIMRAKVGYYVADEVRRFKLERRNRRVVVTNCDGQMFKFGALIGERLAAAIDGERAFDATARWLAGYLEA